MVNLLDENTPPPDHVGWRLWQANHAWLADFVGAMQRAGHAWFTESRANLLGHMPRGGIRQNLLIQRLGISKQAVHQLLDGLETEGIVERVPDPADHRGKLVRYTTNGLAALKDADHAKGEIEKCYRERIGEERFAALMDALRGLAGQ